MLLELMGRDAGFIALHAGVAGGADIILIPEIPFDIDAVCEKITQRAESGRKFSLVSVSEGAKSKDGEQVFSRAGDEVYVARLGGVSARIAQMIEWHTGKETRYTVLGHLQRGGTPSPFDRWLGTRYGAGAVRLAASGGWGRMVGLHGQKIGDVSLGEALAVPKRVDPNGEPVRTARGLGIVFG
jgi:6-phosphofructokinase 1